MKKKLKYIIVLLLFIMVMVLIVFYFMNKYKEIEIVNKAKHVLKDSYELSEGTYLFNDGVISSNSKVISKEDYYLNGSGKIDVDKYGNVKFFINSNDYCVSKTSMGDIVLSKNKCNDFNELNVKMIKNNLKVSFTSLDDNLEYKISDEDNFKGEWIKQDYTGNLTINTYKENTNYIWFKDPDGNISKPLTFNIDCLNANDAKYNSNVFYCSGSILKLDDEEWIVIEDEKSEITLMKNEPLDEKLFHCTKDSGSYCYYKDDSMFSFKWSNSYINYYLNNVYINEISSNIKKLLTTKYLCDDYDNFTCDNDGCGGYKKEVINSNNWNCTNYTPSKIRLLSLDEYNHIYTKIGKNEIIGGHYWMINSFSKDKGSTVDSNYDIYILEDLKKELDIRPVITISK